MNVTPAVWVKLFGLGGAGGVSPLKLGSVIKRDRTGLQMILRVQRPVPGPESQELVAERRIGWVGERWQLEHPAEPVGGDPRWRSVRGLESESPVGADRHGSGPQRAQEPPPGDAPFRVRALDSHRCLLAQRHPVDAVRVRLDGDGDCRLSGASPLLLQAADPEAVLCGDPPDVHQPLEAADLEHHVCPLVAGLR